MLFPDVKKTLKRAVLCKIPCFIWGGPGIGKSSLIKEIAAEEKMKLFDVRLSLLEPSDLRGLPWPDKDSGIVRWLIPDFWPPKDSNHNILLFLDELNQAPKQVQAASLQLLLDRRLGNYTLPEKTSVVAAGNREEDLALVNIMSSALCNRMVHVELETDIDNWIRWAKRENISHEIISFLQFRPELLYKLTGEKAFPTPRTWSMASRLLPKKATDLEMIKMIIVSCVGEASATEFIAWYNYYRNVDVKAILEGKYPKFENKETSYKYAVVSAIGYYLHKHGVKGYEEAIAGFLKLLSPEFRVLLLKYLKENLIRQLCRHSSMREMASQLLKVVVG